MWIADLIDEHWLKTPKKKEKEKRKKRKLQRNYYKY